MPPRILRSYLEGTRERVLWLEFDRYAHRVFANSASDWLTQATRCANTLIQARKAIKTDVLTIDIAAAGLAGTIVGENPVARCRHALTEASAQRYTAECIDAVLHKLGDEVDLVLRVPTPRDFLQACGGDEEPDFDALDDVSTAISGALRGFSDKAIAGLLLTRTTDVPLSADEIDAYAPIFNTAHHYGWVTCMAVSSALLEKPATVDGVDLLLCSELPALQVRELRGTGRGLGGGLPVAAWSVVGVLPKPVVSDLLFGTIPPEANPETVLANCAALAG